MHYKNVAPSHLPSLLLPCSHCGHRMEITAVAPALMAPRPTILRISPIPAFNVARR